MVALHGLKFNVGPQIRQAVHQYNPRTDIHAIRRTATRIEKDVESAQDKTSKVFGISVPNYTDDESSDTSHAQGQFLDPNNPPACTTENCPQVAAFGSTRGRFNGRGNSRGRGRGRGNANNSYNNAPSNNSQNQQQNSNSKSTKKENRFKGRKGQLVKMTDGSVKQIKNGDCFKCGQTGHIDAQNCSNDWVPTAILDKTVNFGKNVNAVAPPDGMSQLESEIGALQSSFNPIPRGTNISLDMCPQFRPGYQNF